MGLAQTTQDELSFAEDIRLIIWDLDETFWEGTLSEGGITYRMDHQNLIVELAKRGIMSAVCSKNQREPVESLLKQTGVWDYLIFPSIDWSPKGPRIQAMLDQIGLRPQSVLFLDDNPMNLAQAAHMNPGLNVALPEVIALLADAPQLQGKPDEGFSRLTQYKVKERKAQAAQAQGTETIEFLRQSNVRAYIEYDVEKHLDRAIELINRTNQLNFTKNRLPDDPAEARAALRHVLSLNTTDAGLIRVRDDFGDYGFVGFYLTRRLHNIRRIEHFCFSCRTLNMYIEHWLYDFLGRLDLQPVGPVLTDPTTDGLRVDWITPAPITDIGAKDPKPMLRFDHIFARGGCDLASLMHFFGLHTDVITEEFNQPRNGQMFRRDHTAFLMPALTGGLNAAQQEAAAALGYGPDDFTTQMQDMPDGRNLYFLSFWADADIPLYRDKVSGLRIPYWLVGAQNQDLIAREDLRCAVAETDLQRERLSTLCDRFEHEGLLQEPEMVQRYATILNALPKSASVVVILANERGPLHFQNPDRPDHPYHKRLNRALRTVARDHPQVILIDPADHITGADDMIDLNHFKRPIYHRMYRDALAQLTEQALDQAWDAADD